MRTSRWTSLFIPSLTIAAGLFVAVSASPIQAQQAQSLCPEGTAAASAVSVDRSIVRSFGRNIVIDVGGFDIARPPETVCGRCALRFYPDGGLAYERSCIRIAWERRCEELIPPSEGVEGFPDSPGVIVCHWEAKIINRFTESCLPIGRSLVP